MNGLNQKVVIFPDGLTEYSSSKGFTWNGAKFNIFTPMPAGRPPIFKDSAELIEAVQDYFDNGIKMRKVVIGKPPNQQIETVPVPTITGLCYHIGFESRQSFYDYEEKTEFSYTVKRARLFIEKEYEEQLQVGNTVGAIFALKNMGWMDHNRTELTGPEGKELNFKVSLDLGGKPNNSESVPGQES